MKPLLRHFLLITIFLIGSGVTVIPNTAIVEGRVEEFCVFQSHVLKIKPDQTLWRLVILIEKIMDGNGKTKFLKLREGQSLVVLTKEILSSDILSKKIRAIVEYRGDERGGYYWIKNIEILELK